MEGIQRWSLAEENGGLAVEASLIKAEIFDPIPQVLSCIPVALRGHLPF